MSNGSDFVLLLVSRRPGGKHRRIDPARTLVEIRMGQGIEGRDAFHRIVGEKPKSGNVKEIEDREEENGLVQQIESFLGETGVEAIAKSIVRIIGEVHLLGKRKAIVVRPDLLVRCAEIFEDAIQLIQFGFTRKQRLHQQQLAEDRSDTPHVDRSGIFLNNEQMQRETDERIGFT